MIDEFDLPNELEYLRSCIAPLRIIWFDNQAIASLDSIIFDRQLLNTFVVAHNEINKRGHGLWINQWIAERTSERSNDQTVRGLINLLTFFDELRERNITPFSQSEIRYVQLLPPRDWSCLSEEFAFVVSDAERYGVQLAENGYDRTLTSFEDSDLKRLSELAGRLCASGKLITLQELMDSLPDASPEVYALNCLLELLDELDLLSE